MTRTAHRIENLPEKLSHTAFSEPERETCRKKRKIANTGYFERLTRRIRLNAEFMREVERRKKERTWTRIGD